MDDILREINMTHIFLGVFGLFLLLQIRQQVVTKSRFFEIWDAFAHTTGLEFENKPLQNTFGKIGPEIGGTYHGKEVRASANYLGLFGQHQALLNITLLVDNPSTEKLPAGAFLVIRRNPKVYGFWNRVRMFLVGEKEDKMNLIDQYQIHGIPRNLGNFIFRQEPARKLIQLPGMLDLHINRQDLSYSYVGHIHDRNFLRQTLDDLGDLAVIFERFAKNWL
ncbi:MAG: hypothetical protein PVF83_16740 [Anaerolineales bacterium]|jgi:hypothetical protein